VGLDRGALTQGDRHAFHTTRHRAADPETGTGGNDPGRLPAPARHAAGTITRAAFTAGLDRTLLVAAIIAFAAGVVSLAAIRSRDFHRATLAGLEGPGQ
jgi:hypothetical protein